jgi:hypothetical protein
VISTKPTPYQTVKRFSPKKKGANDLTITSTTKVFSNSVFKGDFTFYTHDSMEAYHRSSQLDLCNGTAMGKQVWDDGTVFEGSLEFGRFHGTGRLVHVNGDYYEGLWENGEANGYGKWVSFEGDGYDGKWKDSRPSGMGQYDWANGSRYTGNFMGGSRMGQGELVVPGKFMYTGEFNNGQFNAVGVYEWLDGSDRKYSGDFYWGSLRGKGTFTYKNGISTMDRSWTVRKMERGSWCSLMACVGRASGIMAS